MTDSLDFAAYRSLPGINWSSLKSMRTSPLQYQWDLVNERKDTPAMRMGRAAHALVLEPGTFAANFATWDGTRRGKAWTAFQAEHEHRDIITVDEHETVRGIAGAVLRNQEARRYLVGQREQVVRWTDPDSGLQCKARLDVAGAGVTELKTARAANPHAFSRDAARLGYHGQLAFYNDGLSAVAKRELRDPVMVIVQSEAPYDVMVLHVPGDVVEAGRVLYQRLLQRVKQCQTAGRWPGACETMGTLYLPAWADDDVQEEAPITASGVAISF